MPSEFRIVPIALAASALLTSWGAIAAQPESSSKGTGAPAAAIESQAEAHAQFLAKRLESLHTALKLKPEQEAAWKQWSESVKATRPDWKGKHGDAANLATLSVPDRLERMVAFAKERLARLEERLAETKKLYEVLTPEQRLTFDKDFNFWPHAGRSGKVQPKGRSLIGPRIGTQ